MTAVFAWGALVLAAAGSLVVVALALRRVQLARAERAGREAEARMRPVALALVEGEPAPPAELLRGDAEALARLLARYSRWLSGGARSHIASFFERGGGVGAEVAKLESRRSWRRATAAFSLGDMASQRAVAPLVGALGDADRDVRAAAARSLGRLGAVEAVVPLVYALGRGDLPRAVTGAALLAIGPAALPELRSLEARADAEVRAIAVELVGLLGDVGEAPLLLGRLRDSAAEVRAKAARALGRLAAEDAAAELRRMLHDRIPFVRTAAATALGSIRDREALGALLRQAKTDRFEPAQAAARAVARIDPRAAVEASAAADAGPHLREAADLARVGGAST